MTATEFPRYDDLERERDALLRENDQLRETIGELTAKCKKISAWLHRVAADDEVRAKDKRFISLAEACAADAKNYRATAADIDAAIAKAEGSKP